MAKADILIVDDEEGMLVVMQAILEMEGYGVAAAQKGAVAIELLRQREFDVILTDLRLDDLDGMAILAAKNRWSPDTVAIMLTGYASLDSAVQALRQGAYDYLIKPCDVEELKATVARAVERRQLAQQLRARMSELEEANATIQQMNAQLQERVDEATAELRQQSTIWLTPTSRSRSFIRRRRSTWSNCASWTGSSRSSSPWPRTS